MLTYPWKRGSRPSYPGMRSHTDKNNSPTPRPLWETLHTLGDQGWSLTVASCTAHTYPTHARHSSSTLNRLVLQPITQSKSHLKNPRFCTQLIKTPLISRELFFNPKRSWTSLSDCSCHGITCSSFIGDKNYSNSYHSENWSELFPPSDSLANINLVVI